MVEEKKTGISPESLLLRIRWGEELFLLDVRNEEDRNGWPFEFISADRQVNIPYIEFIEAPEEVIPTLPDDRNIVVLCAKGGASDYVANELLKSGRSATNIAGGMKAFGKVMTAATVWGDHKRSVVQFNRVGKGCLSYLLISGDEAAAVDPGRHIDRYVQYLLDHGLKLTAIFDTHLHADHISGGRTLAVATGATYYAHPDDMGESPLPYTPLCEEKICLVGESRVTVTTLHAPGHTPGSTAILFDGAVLFTGDTLFLSSMGRPDLGGRAAEWVGDLWGSVRGFDRFDDDLLILPAHTSGLVEFDNRWQVKGTLGELRRTNHLLTLDDRVSFDREILSHLPDQPESYQKMREANLGTTVPDDEGADLLELGKNRCAVSQAGEAGESLPSA